ncbi:hypothetical protein [Candidatus Paracaedibacter symbiosus]|uniref:hypothetical protein n=1 Tax=Candidatus Paracaedibacter symbiosus TaxID=244582 RepID=UPI000509D885|nr:hypothetical protein [Candidatus Paracaedibacter symbiosus]
MFLKTSCLVIALTLFNCSISFEAKSSDSKKMCLINDPKEYTSEEWLPRFITYTEQKGRQRHRLEQEKDYTKSYIRFVKDEDKLKVGYGLLRQGESIALAPLKLSSKIYGYLSQLGLILKVLNGYVNDFDIHEKSFTPDKSNIYVPHISFVIQWDDNSIPKLIPGGMLKDDKGADIVFMSGNGKADTQQKIEDFYNFIYKDKDGPKVAIYSGDNVADAYIPCALYDGIVNDEWEVFQPWRLAEVAKKIADICPYIKDTKDNIIQQKNTINFTSRFLSFLFKNDLDSLFKLSQDTVRVLLEMMPPPKPAIEEEGEQDKKRFKEASFKAFLRDKKELFISAALDQIKNSLGKLEDNTQKTDILNLLIYISSSANPDSLKELETSRQFWGLIKKLGNMLTCPNPDSAYGPNISFAERIRKYAIGGYGSHSERVFVKLIRTNPQLLIRSLDKIKEEHKKDILEGTQPKLLGIIVDAYSWLDTCTKCGKFLHENILWPKLLSELRSSIEEKGFSLPFPHIYSVFRVLAHEQYYGMPSNLEKAGGGPDYTSTGWDFRVLSELRYTLATRQPSSETLPRDRVFERVSNTIVKAALVEQLDFWYTHPAITQVLLSTKIEGVTRGFTSNVINILCLRFPDSLPLCIRKIKMLENDKENFEEVYQVAHPFVKSPLEIDETDQQFINRITMEFKPNEYLPYVKANFGKACLKKARLAFKANKRASGWQYMLEFTRFGMVHSSCRLEMSEAQPIFSHIIKYYKDKYDQKPYNIHDKKIYLKLLG